MDLNLLEKAKILYEYAYPVLATDLFIRAPKEAYMKINHIRKLATADGKSFKPNNDTLYSVMFLQLANSPYILEIPRVEDRYLLVDILDMKTEVFFATGTKDADYGAGKYILLYRNEPVPAGCENYRVIRSDDSKNLLLIRTETFGEDDYGKANSIQDKFVIKPVQPEKIQDHGTPLQTTFLPVIEAMSVKEYLESFINLLTDTKIDEEIDTILKELGIDTADFNYGRLDEDTRALLEKGFKEAYEEIRNYDGPEGYKCNGWKTYVRDIGHFGKNYLFRAYVAWFAYGANLAEDSIYPVTYTDIQGNVLASDKTYRVHFKKDGLPKAKFFWSVTLYGEPSCTLAANPLNRYVINSHGIEQLQFNGDGSLDIIISRTKPEDEKYFNNWLPSPADEAAFSLLMRIYGADSDILEKKWDFPVVQLA